MNEKQILGFCGEEFAAAMLANDGYEIIIRNYRTRLGEIDIIARKGKVIHFIEVKTRATVSCGLPSESITPDKQRRIRRVAEIFLSNTKLIWEECSFDAFVIEADYLEGCM